MKGRFSVKFSVIIPAYGAQNTLERCVDSLMANICTAEVEIIVVEDCSKDGTWAVCQRLAARYPAVKALRNDVNRGVSFTRNRGLQAASGEYVLFADSDDWVEPTYIASFQHVLETTGCSFAVCGYVNHDEKNNGRTDIFAWPGNADVQVKELQGELKALYDHGLLQQLWNKVFLLSEIRKAKLCFDERISIGEDMRFILGYLQVAGPERAALINRPLYHYMRDQAGSLMFRVGYESVEEPLKNLRMLYTLMGMTPDVIEAAIETDRRRQIELYAYLIIHNAGMSMKEKRRLVLALDEKMGRKLYRENRRVYIKEQLAIFLKKLGRCAEK